MIDNVEIGISFLIEVSESDSYYLSRNLVYMSRCILKFISDEIESITRLIHQCFFYHLMNYASLTKYLQKKMTKTILQRRRVTIAKITNNILFIAFYR
jgi:uncharacterized membrane protein YkgB